MLDKQQRAPGCGAAGRLRNAARARCTPPLLTALRVFMCMNRLMQSSLSPMPAMLNLPLAAPLLYWGTPAMAAATSPPPWWGAWWW